MKNRIILFILLIIGLSYSNSIQLIPEYEYRFAETKINKLANKMKNRIDELEKDTITIKSFINSNSFQSKSGEKYFFDRNGIFSRNDKFMHLYEGDELIIYYKYNTIYFIDGLIKKPEWVATGGSKVSSIDGRFYTIKGTLNRQEYESHRQTYRDPNDHPDFEVLLKTIKEKKLCKIIEKNNDSSKLTCLAYSPREGKGRIGGYYGISDNMVDSREVERLSARDTTDIFLKALLRTTHPSGGCNKSSNCFKSLLMLSSLINNNPILVDGTSEGPSLESTRNIKEPYQLSIQRGGSENIEKRFNRRVKVILNGKYEQVD